MLNPPFVFGPVVNQVANAAALNEYMHDWLDTVVMGTRDVASLVTMK